MQSNGVCGASMDDAQRDEAARLIKGARRLVVFTGAGMSADSGISTFRKAGASGLWSGLKGTLGLAFFGTPIGWKLTPGLAWSMYCKEFYGPIADAQPHVGHEALARLEQSRTGQMEMTVITMNVDGFHSRAGNTNCVEVHGTVERIICYEHGAFPMPKGPDINPKKVRCPTCGARVRPDVVLFTESLPPDEWSRASAAVRSLQQGDVMLVIGTTGGVYPAAGLPERALRAGVSVIEVNKDPSPISAHVDVYIEGRAAEIIPSLVDAALT